MVKSINAYTLKVDPLNARILHFHHVKLIKTFVLNGKKYSKRGREARSWTAEKKPILIGNIILLKGVYIDSFD